ncbi:unnamed protein product [Boreogadus saida]
MTEGASTAPEPQEDYHLDRCSSTPPSLVPPPVRPASRINKPPLLSHRMIIRTVTTLCVARLTPPTSRRNKGYPELQASYCATAEHLG